jgi:hypothetical protein
MRLRPAHETPDVLDRWFAVKPTSPSSANISEPTLVALGGIVALCDDIPDWSVQPNATATTGAPAPKQSIIGPCVSAFAMRFPQDWPPTPEAIAAFRALRRSL